MAKKDSEREFIPGVSQGTYKENLGIESYRNNFMYQLYAEAQNWQDYYMFLNIEQYIDEAIKNSKFRILYESLENIPNEEAVEIYFYLKPLIQKKFLVASDIYIFLLIMQILGVKLNNIMNYMPFDEKRRFLDEIESRNPTTKKENELY